MTEEEFFAFLDKRHKTLEGVAITGGEPTLQPDLPDLLETAAISPKEREFVEKYLANTDWEQWEKDDNVEQK